MKKILSILAAAVILLPLLAENKTGFVYKKNEKLFLNGKEYRAIGVNMPNLHQSYLGTWHHNIQIYGTHDAARQAMITGVEDAAKSGFKFIRFFASPGYPYDMTLLYMKDREAYWKGMDEVFDLCRKHNIRLIPCLNVAGAACKFNDYYDEPRQAVLDPKSKTYKAVYDYMREFVTRYKDDPIVLMWELQNEGMLKADIDKKSKKRNSCTTITRDQKPRPPYVREDSMNFDMLVKLYKQHASFIKSLDKNHLITSGDAGVRRECTSRRETFPNFKFRSDTFRENVGNNLLSQPEPLDVFSYHAYGSLQQEKQGAKQAIPPMDRRRRLIRATMATGSPVFIGELAVRGQHLKFDPEQRWTQQYIDMAEKEGVSLIALWVWHFAWQPHFTMSSEKFPALIKRCVEFNRKYASE